MAKSKGYRRPKVSTRDKELTMGDFSKPSLKDPYPRGLSKGWHGVDTIHTLPRFKGQQSKKLKALKKEAKSLNRQAQTQIRHLLKTGLETPALSKYLGDGGQYFSVAGKNYKQVQSEVATIKRFLNAKTSTVKGTERVLKTMADNIGRPFTSREQLIAESRNFFELASKTEQYLRMVKDNASALGYQKIWDSINEYVSNQEIALDDTRLDVNSMIEEIANLVDANNDTKIITAEIKQQNSLYL